MADFRELLAATGYGPRGGELIFFPALEVSTSGGHDSAKHLALRVRGADVETTGQKPYTVKMRIALLEDLEQAGGGKWDDGPWHDVYRRLIESFEANPIGTLSHPLRGQMTVHVDEWDDKIAADVRNGVFIDVSFTEHNGDSDLSGVARKRRTEDPPTTALTRAKEADAAGAVLTTHPSLLTPTITATLDALEIDGIGYGEKIALVDGALAAVRGNLALPYAYASYPYRIAAELLVASLYDVRDYYLGLAKPSVFVVPAPMSLMRIASLPEVYGDPSLVTLLREANRVPDPVLVPAGTRIVVPPAAS